MREEMDGGRHEGKRAIEEELGSATGAPWEGQGPTSAWGGIERIRRRSGNSQGTAVEGEEMRTTRALVIRPRWLPANFHEPWKTG